MPINMKDLKVTERKFEPIFSSILIFKVDFLEEENMLEELRILYSRWEDRTNNSKINKEEELLTC